MTDRRPPAQSMFIDPATGRLVTAEELSAIGLDLMSNQQRDQQAMQADRGSANVPDAAYSMLTNGAMRPTQPQQAQPSYMGQYDTSTRARLMRALTGR